MKAALLLSLSLWVVAGCGKPDTADPAPAAAPAAGAPANLPSLQAGAQPAAPPSQGIAPAPAPPPAVDFAAKDRPVNAAGDPMSDLELLNEALANYNEALATGTAGGSGPARTYKTEAEQMAAEDARQKAIDAGGYVKDLSELVKAGVLKALPAPPPGKRFAIDPKTRKAVLVGAP